MTNPPTGGSALHFAATVSAEMRPVVEALFFFNPRQSLLIENIRAAVEAKGTPVIKERAGQLWIDLPSDSLQCLFVCDSRAVPVGVMLYGRPSSEVLEIAHLAVDPAHASGQGGQPSVGLLLVEKAQAIARSIKGISKIQLPYQRARFLPVRAPSPGERTE